MPRILHTKGTRILVNHSERGRYFARLTEHVWDNSDVIHCTLSQLNTVHGKTRDWTIGEAITFTTEYGLIERAATLTDRQDAPSGKVQRRRISGGGKSSSSSS